MSKLKAALSVVVAALTTAVGMNLPAPWGAIAAAALAGAAYAVNHDDLLSLVSKPAKPRGFSRLGAMVSLVVMVWLGSIACLAYGGHGTAAVVFAVLLCAAGVGRYSWRTELVGLALALFVVHTATACGVSALVTPEQRAKAQQVAFAACVAYHDGDRAMCLTPAQLEAFHELATELVNAAGRADAGPVPAVPAQ